MSVENIEFAGEASHMVERLVADHLPNHELIHGGFCECPRHKVRAEEWVWRFSATVNGKTAAVLVAAPGPWEDTDEEQCATILIEAVAPAFENLAAGVVRENGYTRKHVPESEWPEHLRMAQETVGNLLYWPPKGTT